MPDITKELVRRFDRPGPRYTSYPTAPEWNDDVGPEAYREKLRLFDRSHKTLSLYVHIPFCESLCYFCGCTMNVRPQKSQYGDEYLDYLEREIHLVAHELSRRPAVRQLHWGGGTPSYLSEDQMERLYAMLRDHFDIDPDGEIAIEVDPRRVTRSKVETLRRLGFNRISIGLQDFDPRVQAAVNRDQPYPLVETFTRWCRELDFDSMNFDLIYGLPLQTRETFHRTVTQVIGLAPDRIALYSFAYVPWLKKHQQRLDPAAIPKGDEKLDIFLESRRQLLENGYEAIAMDHFARHDDAMAAAFRSGELYRNFMGYTLKPADDYIGLGTSAIGFLEHTFLQNVKTIPAYYERLEAGELPVERGKALSPDDRIRQWVIWSLMCRFRLDREEFRARFAHNFDEYFLNEADHCRTCINDGLLTDDGRVLCATELGRIFVRNICMGFDWYLRQHNAHRQFSQTV